MSIDLHNITLDHQSLLEAMKNKEYEKAYQICTRISETYLESDSDKIYWVNDLVDEADFIKLELAAILKK